ncbi:MAG: glycerol kinase [Actinobacteria bacterium]|nr:glycerol kinase [Microbacteriaceae bacterium]NBS61642.1 glycerol kinase [Microbacteriaceae bacterium]NBS86019.1 glycerol kinase [Micrococcales bacterium]NBX94688.1 glycerol kinase [Actinomycetota bacterium]
MILAIDSGTTGVTAIAVNDQGEIIARGYQEFPQHFPQPGWVEHNLEEIWSAVLSSVQQVIDKVGKDFKALGITNQRETIGLWDRETLRSPRNAIVWQDRRTTEILIDLENHPTYSKVRALTGLPLDPYFSAAKLRWIAKHEPEIWNEVIAGKTLVGTIDSYVIARATNGTHITDASNASRTQLYDIHTGTWSKELADLFEIPLEALPTIVNSSGELARTDPESFFGLAIPISGIAGDQQAALFGQTQFQVGGAKCTYGTGAFILQNIGNTPVVQTNGLITTVAWQLNGVRTYASEGSVFVAGAAVQWLRDELQLFAHSKEVEDLATSVPDSAGVVFVPALTGLGAPYWKPDARGALLGLTRGTSKAHIARATLEALAFQVRDIFEAMASTGIKLSHLRVDGGAAENNLMLQIQADQLDARIERPVNIDSTALGAAYLAGLGVGIWKSLEELKELNPIEVSFTKQNDSEAGYSAWKRAVQATIAFTEK